MRRPWARPLTHNHSSGAVQRQQTLIIQNHVSFYLILVVFCATLGCTMKRRYSSLCSKQNSAWKETLMHAWKLIKYCVRLYLFFFSVIYVEHKHNIFSVNGTNCFGLLHILTKWFVQVADLVSRPSKVHLKASVEQAIIVVTFTFQGLVISLFISLKHHNKQNPYFLFGSDVSSRSGNVLCHLSHIHTSLFVVLLSSSLHNQLGLHLDQWENR